MPSTDPAWFISGSFLQYPSLLFQNNLYNHFNPERGGHMIIRCYGARGSIPVSGREYLKYGGDTTCIEIRSKNDEIIIVDTGSGVRRLGNRLLSEKRFEYNIIFTHSHWDHILGFPFFKPIYDEKTVLNLMGCTTTQGNLKKLLSRTMSQPFFPPKIAIDHQI